MGNSLRPAGRALKDGVAAAVNQTKTKAAPPSPPHPTAETLSPRAAAEVAHHRAMENMLRSASVSTMQVAQQARGEDQPAPRLAAIAALDAGDLLRMIQLRTTNPSTWTPEVLAAEFSVDTQLVADTLEYVVLERAAAARADMPGGAVSDESNRTGFERPT